MGSDNNMTCKKIRYKTEFMAIKNLVFLQRRFIKAMRHYRCPLCKGWHLTTSSYVKYVRPRNNR